MASTPNHSNATISSEVEQIDAAIKKHQQQIQTLKARRNELASTTARLPPEIMTNILLCARAVWPQCCPNGRFSASTLPRCMHWVVISHVSTHWRSIALSSVELWTDPPFLNALWAEEMLKRSNLQLSVIRFDFQSLKTSPIFRQALLHCGRVRKLCLLDLPGKKKDWDDLPKNIPRLEDLTVSGRYNTLISVPSSLLSASGRLRKLVITRCQLPWPPENSCSITHLDLRYTCLTVTFTEFIDSLKRLTELQYLCLIHTIPFSGTTNRPMQPTLLSKLKTLRIESLVEEAISFFYNITFPSSASVNIEVDKSQIPEDLTLILTDMLPIVARSYSDQRSCIAPSSMVLNDISASYFRFLLGHVVRMPDQSEHVFSLIIQTTTEMDLSNYTNIITTVFHSGLPMDDVKHVKLISRGGGCLTAALFAQTVGQLAKVSNIEAEYPMASFIVFKALQLDIFPNLSSLKFEELHLVSPQSSRNPYATKDYRISFEEFTDALTHRCETGAEITQLVLRDCWYLYEKHVRALKDIVVNVDCDEVDREEDDEESDEF